MTTSMAHLPDLPDPILVVGGYGYRNIGDEAILAGLLREMRTRRLTVVSRSPAETSALHGVPSVGLAQALAALRAHRSIIIGGGGLFGRDMGRLGQLLGPFGMLASLAGRSVAMHAVGVDADLPSPVAWTLKRLAERAVSCTVRDRSSQAVLAQWGIAASLTDDLSAAMVPAGRREGRALLRAAGVDAARPLVGLALTAVRPDAARNLELAVAELVDAMPDVEFCFIPMSQHPFVARHNDLLLAQRLQVLRPRLAILAGVPHPATLLSAFGLLSGVVGMRYHSLLFAERTGVPLVAVPYAEKCQAWLAEHDRSATPLEGRALVGALRAGMAERMVRSA